MIGIHNWQENNYKFCRQFNDNSKQIWKKMWVIKLYYRFPPLEIFILVRQLPLLNLGAGKRERGCGTALGGWIFDDWAFVIGCGEKILTDSGTNLWFCNEVTLK